jgi:uncharacterized protein (DUF885 family)
MASVKQLADQMLAIMHDENPIAASQFSIPGYDDRLPDLRAESATERRTRAEQVARQVDSADTETRQDTLTRAVIVQQAAVLADRAATRLVEHTLAHPLTAPAGKLLVGLPVLRPKGEVAEQGYLIRLAAIPEYLDQAVARHREGVEAGRLPVARAGRAGVAYLDRYLADPDGDPLARPELSESRSVERERLLADVVRPAFRRYRDVLDTELTPQGRPDEQPGLCWLPDGETKYATLARMHTTTERSPEELHRTGLELIERLAEEYAEVGSRAFGKSTAAQVMQRLRTDPELRWGSAEELLATARATIERAEAASPAWFGRLPEARCVVEPAPPGEAPGSPPAYYLRPALDGSRPGTYFANTYLVEERDRFTAEGIAFHEAVPGHHFQLALAQELTELPLLRRLARVTAYAEGWGLYAERLADEMGLYSSDLARLGMLAADSLRAARLVVDTGLHALGWTRQQVVDYLRANTVMSEVDLQAETDRYIEWPGQALSYMVGRLEIARLRAEAARELGSAFDIRGFHDTVLGNGILPLSVLAQVVGDWVTARR